MSTAGRDARRSGSLRARLAERRRPHLPYPLLVDDPTEAQQQLDAARQELRQVLIRGDDTIAAQAAVAQAQADLDGCYAHITLTALRPADYEALIAAHPPTVVQAAETPPQIWNPDSFRPALLAACADGDMTADDWTSFLAERCSQGERQGLYVAALIVNEQERIAEPLVLPKGWTTNRS